MPTKKKTKRSTKAKSRPKTPKRVAKKKKKSVAKAKPAARKATRKPARKAARKAAPRRAAPKAKGLRREDRPGHFDPKYAKALRAESGRMPAEPRAFIVEPRANDDLAQELAEEALETATSGEYDGEDRMNADVPEDVGGPFVQTTPKQEFAHGTDPSNPKSAKKEPFPTT
jgi:hypothetical protein